MFLWCVAAGDGRLRLMRLDNGSAGQGLLVLTLQRRMFEGAGPRGKEVHRPPADEFPPAFKISTYFSRNTVSVIISKQAGFS